MNRLKILFICPTVACYIGGTETVVSQLCQRMKDNVDLTLLSGDSGQNKQILINTEGIELITVPFIGRDSRLNHVLSKFFMSSRFKIESYSFFRSLAKHGLDLSKYDYIATFYEADAYLLTRRYPSLQERFRHFLPGVSGRRFFKHVPAENVFFLGYRSAPKAKRKWNVSIQSVPLGVDSVFFPEKPVVCPAIKRLIYIGRLDKSKHVDWLADFFAGSDLAAQGYQLDIVGDGPLLNELMSRHENLKSITFHGRKRQQEVVGILQTAFLLLHPSDLESFGLTILEAMSAGVPVITHDLSSVKAWAKDHPRYAGHLEKVSWRDEILKFEQRTYWEKVSAENLEYAKSFTWDKVADQVLNLIMARSSGTR